MKKQSSISRLMRLFASFVEQLDDSEVESLLAGKAKLIVVSGIEPTKKSQATYSSIEDVVRALDRCVSREEAIGVLKAVSTKEALQSIAKEIKVHVVKHDRREDIEEKIVAFVVGRKLRTEAIFSLNLKGGTNQSEDG